MTSPFETANSIAANEFIYPGVPVTDMDISPRKTLPICKMRVIAVEFQQ